MDAVVLDLFGTLVAAPTPHERTQAASRLAAVLGRPTATVEDYLTTTWQVRHDGTLPTLTALAAHLTHAVHRPDTARAAIADELRSLAHGRLQPDPSVLHTLQSLRGQGVRLGVLSDASAEIATAWPHSPLANLVDIAVFSCHSGAIKPDQRLYHQVRTTLATPAHRMLYVGDGGGDELRGAQRAGMIAIGVHRRGPADTLAFGAIDWPGLTLDAVEHLPTYLKDLQR